MPSSKRRSPKHHPRPPKHHPRRPRRQPEVVVKPSFRDRLAKARGVFAGYVGSVLARSKIDDETWDDLEEALIRADVGIGPTTELLDAVRARVKDENITEPAALVDAMKDEIEKRLVGDRVVAFRTGAAERLAVRRCERCRQDDDHRQVG